MTTRYSDETKAILRRLAKFIEANGHLPFNMVRHEHCMMGFLEQMLPPAAHPAITSLWFAENTGMTHDQARALCLTCDWFEAPDADFELGEDERLSLITRKQAVAHLREISQ